MKHNLMRPTLLIVCFVILLFGTFACNDKKIYNAYRHLPEEGWERGDTLRFLIDSVKNGGLYNIQINLRTNYSFRFQKLWLVVEQEYTHPVMVRKDTLPCVLATPNGDILGNGISLHDYSFPLCQQQLTTGQRGYITIKHIMRSDFLEGIVSIGAKVERQ